MSFVQISLAQLIFVSNVSCFMLVFMAVSKLIVEKAVNNPYMQKSFYQTDNIGAPSLDRDLMNIITKKPKAIPDSNP